MSERSTYLAAGAAVAELVGRIEGGWERPGLGEWDLRALVGHTSRSLVTVLTYLDRPAARQDIASAEDYYLAASFLALAAATDQVAERGRQAGRALGERPEAAFVSLLEQVEARLSGTSDGDLIETIAGGMRVVDYLPTRTFELVVHGLDIAAATGLDLDLPEPALAEATALAGRIATRRGQAPTLLLALTGRAPLPDRFSIL